MKKEVIVFVVLLLLIAAVSSQEEYAPGEIIVKFKDSGNSVNNFDSKNEIDIEVVEKEKIIENEELYKIKFSDDVNVLDVVEQYRKMRDVEYAEPNFIMKSSLIPNDEDYNSLYWPSSINAEFAWNLTAGNKEVVIAIIDTGVDWNHPDLSFNIFNGSDYCDENFDKDNNSYFGDCRGYDFTDINTTNYVNSGYVLIDGEDYDIIDNNPMDFDGHGTHVAGISGAVGNNEIGVIGSCWNCSVMPVRSGFKIITSSGSSIGSLEIDDVVKAIYYAADNNADVISMSFGGGDSDLVRDAIEYAYDKGIVLVASAGNSGSNGKQYPCAYDEVICVGATDSDGSYSSYSNYGEWVKIAAPGTAIWSTFFDDSYKGLTGTSMSTPLTTGVIGLIKSISNKNQSEILKGLIETGKIVDFNGVNISKIDAYSALLYFDEIPPVVELVNPKDGEFNLTLNQTFECSAEDWQLYKISLKIFNSDSSLFYSESKNISGIYNSSKFNVILDKDSYQWNCYAEDEKVNGNYAKGNFSIYTDGTVVNLESPINNSYTNLSFNYFYCSFDSNSLENISQMNFHLWNGNDLIYSEEKDAINLSQFNFNYTFSEQGSYFWSCSVKNNLNQSTYGGNYTLYYDNINPIVTLLSPEDLQEYNSNNQAVEFSFSVNEESSCSLTVNDGEKKVFDNSLNGRFEDNFSPAEYSWKVACEDLAGNSAESEIRTFSINAVNDGGGDSGGDSSESTGSSSSGSGGESIISNIQNKNNESSLDKNIPENSSEDNFEIDNNFGITGQAIDESLFNIGDLDKYRNGTNIFTALLLICVAFLFYRDYLYEKEINKEIELLEKE